METHRRDHWGLKSGNRNGEDRLNLSGIFGLELLDGGSTDLGREGSSPSSGGCMAR